MKLKDKYCTVCGKKREIIEIDMYDADTGKKVFQHAECSIQDCKHGHHEFKSTIFGHKPCACGIKITDLYPHWI